MVLLGVSGHIDPLTHVVMNRPFSQWANEL